MNDSNYFIYLNPIYQLQNQDFSDLLTGSTFILVIARPPCWKNSKQKHSIFPAFFMIFIVITHCKGRGVYAKILHIVLTFKTVLLKKNSFFPFACFNLFFFFFEC